MWTPGNSGREVVVRGNPDQAIKKFIRKSRDWKPDRPPYFQSKSEIRKLKRQAHQRAKEGR